MKKEFEDELKELAKDWMHGADSPQTSCMYWGFAIGDGWYPLVKELLLLAKHQQKNFDREKNFIEVEAPEKYPDLEERRKRIYGYDARLENAQQPNPFDSEYFQLEQVKEKFGGLRFYYYGGDAEFEGAVRIAENLSYVTCEDCGSPGVHRSDLGWQRTLCDKHYKEIFRVIHRKKLHSKLRSYRRKIVMPIRRARCNAFGHKKYLTDNKFGKAEHCKRRCGWHNWNVGEEE